MKSFWIFLAIYVEFTNSALFSLDLNENNATVVNKDEANSPQRKGKLNNDTLGIILSQRDDIDNIINNARRNNVKDGSAARRAYVLRRRQLKETQINTSNVDASSDKLRHLEDPVLSILRGLNLRKTATSGEVSDDVISQSSSRETSDFEEQFKALWDEKKYEAISAKPPEGDMVNMVAARPWGQKCGDPGQHDMPWGSCMLAMECEPEYRIARGDVFCGRSAFVCCALDLETYDMYQGFDVSFEDKGISQDTNELYHESGKSKGSKSNKKKERKRNRKKRKDKIKKSIKNIVKEIDKILNTMYRNSTKMKKRKTKQMKRFIKALKEEYRKNRLVVRDIHEEYMIHVDEQLMKKLEQIKQLNKDFVNNSTFRDIIVNGTMSVTGARMLIQAYPELEEFIQAERRSQGRGDLEEGNLGARNPGRRIPGDNNNKGNEGKKSSDGNPAGNQRRHRNKDNLKPDYLDYDVEYGFLYY